MKSFKFLLEAAYAGNIGFQEMVKFYQTATKQQEKEMDRIIASNNWEAFKKLVFKVIGTELK